MTGLAAATPAVGLTTSGAIIRFDTSTPGTITASPALSGLQAGEIIVAIDHRPATGRLYGLSNQSRIYAITVTTGAAHLVGAIGMALSGTDFGFDINPVVDRIRITSNTGQNFRAHPDTGALAVVDTALNFAPGDVHDGTAPTIVASAYTNSVAGAVSTALYGIDANFDALVLQISPNAGVLQTVGGLGVNTSSVVGFDIDPANNVLYAALEVGGASSLYTINQATGAVTLVGAIGSGQNLRGLAIAPGAWIIGLTTSNTLVRFDSRAPATAAGVATAITGLQASESIVAIDYRPVTGALYGVSDQSRLFAIDPVTGAAAVVGSPSFTLSGSQFGFDVNPTVDRIRITSDSGQNIRVHPATGALASTDTTLNYASGDLHFGAAPTVAGVAYTNNVVGAVTTTLYGIDTNFDSLVQHTSPNGGTLSTIGGLGVNTSAVLGFDIEPVTNAAYAALEVGGNSSLYTIDLATGAATLVGSIAGGQHIRGIAIVLFGSSSAPSVVTATAAGSAQVIVAWSAVYGAETYEVARQSTPGGGYTVVATVAGLSYADTSVAAGSAYLYRLRAVPAGGSASSDSVADLATAMLFTEDPLAAATTPIRAVHLTEIRSAIGAVRALAGLGPATVTDGSPAGVLVKSVHVTELRAALDAARSTLGLTPLAYANSAAAGTLVRAGDVTELRNGVK